MQGPRVRSEGQSINVMVAEDCPFQRIAIIDLLQLCGYTVVACENGLLARDELLKSEVDFDLILLDLLMPEMDGLELLKIIKSISKLKDIPVIMMSANNENIYLGACLQAGALDYLVKPVNFKKLQALEEHVRKRPKAKNDSEKAYYSIIRNVGKGASGSVDLVRRSTDQELFAMKSIPMYYMSEQEKKSSQNEVSLLKVLISPTIIRYYESFTEKDSINIIMEYAEGGSLHDLVQQHTITGEKFDKDQILYWLAQLVIAIQFMHDKNILHRDIKTQNMFLKQNIIKLGDFGISKALGTNNDFAKTFLGTPYFMPPEVINNEQYGVKADIWALGCALYELVMLRRPFQHDVMPMVFEMIVKQPHKIDEGTDPELAAIIDMLLQKDPNKRPTIWTLAKYPIIEKKIAQFYESHPDETGAFTRTFPDNKQSLEKSQIPEAPCVQKVIHEMMNSIQLRNVSKGYFNQVQYVCVTGADIHSWIANNLDKAGPEIQEMANQLFEQKLIAGLNNETSIMNSDKVYYTFYLFMPLIAANNSTAYTGGSLDIAKICQNLINKLKIIQKKIIKKNEICDFEQTYQSKDLYEFLTMSLELQKATMIDYNPQMKLATFLNIYQIMRFHKAFYDYQKLNVKKNKILCESKGILPRLLAYIFCEQENMSEFVYCIGGQNYTLSDIKHGVLRNNKQCQDFRQWTQQDKRLIGADIKDIFIIFKEEYCTESPLFWEIEFVAQNQAPLFIASYLRKFIQKYVCLDMIESEIIVHPFVEHYKQDISNTEKDLIIWLLDNLDQSSKQEQILKQYENKEFYLRFKDPNL